MRLKGGKVLIDLINPINTVNLTDDEIKAILEKGVAVKIILVNIEYVYDGGFEQVIAEGDGTVTSLSHIFTDGDNEPIAVINLSLADKLIQYYEL